jgi:ISXO2-like transposase domain
LITNLQNMFKGQSLKSFRKEFQSEKDCIDYLIKLKWSNGFKCRKCSHAIYGKGRKYGYRRCKNCYYDESATSNTLFHKLKINILDAFEICFQVSVSKKSLSNHEISRQFEIHVNSALYLRERIQNAMKSSEKHTLEGNIEVDEFVVGGHEVGMQGRSDGDKKKAIIGAEIRGKSKKGYHYGRVYIELIDDFSSKSFKPFFEKHISKNAKIKTDKWRGYIPLKKAFENLEQEVSEAGVNFNHIHTLIMNFKSWLRGVHHHCTTGKFQDYLNEFCFKFNRRQYLSSIFDKLISRIAQAEPLYLSRIAN